MKIEFAFKLSNCWAIITDERHQSVQISSAANQMINIVGEDTDIKIQSTEATLRDGVHYLGFRLDPSVAIDMKKYEGAEITLRSSC